MSTETILPFPASATDGASMGHVKLLLWEDLETYPFPERSLVIEPILKERQVAMIYAPTGVGKTWLTLSLAVTAASGDGAGFLGFQGVGDGTKVLLIDGEMDAEDLQHRIDLVVSAVNADKDKVRRNLIIASRQHQPFDASFPDIADPDWQDEVLRYCEQETIRFLVLDNFSTLAPSIEDENSSAKIGKVNAMLLKAKQTEVTCILVHHANKSNGSYRGSSNIGVTLDLIIALNRPENYTNVDGETAFTIEFEKVRGSVSRSVTTARTVVFKTGPEGSTWKEDDHPATQGHLIKLKLESLRFTTQRELAEHLGWQQPNLSKKIKQAIAAGIFKEEELRAWFQQAKEIRQAGGQAENDDSEPTERNNEQPTISVASDVIVDAASF
jgi:KaiC/GvpD/RAD55 family RecA-like ATPase